MQPIRHLVTVFITVAIAAGAALTQVKPQPTPALRPAVTAPAPKTTRIPVQVFDKPARYIVGHHQGATAWTVPLQARRWFVDVQGYADVAYNAMITPQGVIWKGRGEEFASAASYGINHTSVAFCWLGNLNDHPPTDAQLVAAAAYVKAARVRHPGALLIGHKDVAKIARNNATTACPGTAAVKANSLRAVWLMVCGYPLHEAKRRALAGK